MSEISDYITNDYRAIDSNESVKNVKDFFLEERFSHFPVTDSGVYIGTISSEDVETFDELQSIGNYRYALEGFYARTTAIWLDVLELFARNHTNVMPVLDPTNKYVGYYEITDVLKLFNDTPFLKEQGGIIVVEKGVNDYSIGQITQIVESNNGKILGLFVSKLTVSSVEVTIKVAIGSINEILQGFRRYEYNVVSEHQEDTYLNSLKERSDYLDKYLNI